MSTGADRRQRRKAATRHRIVACAAELFATNGYDTTTVEAVAECADVARATVFNHFDRKEDLVLAWFDRRREDLAGQLAPVADTDADTASIALGRTLRTIARFFSDDTDAGRAMARVWLQAGGPMRNVGTPSDHIFTQTLRAGHQRGELARDADPDQAGAVLFHAYVGVLQAWANSSDDGFSLERNLLDVLEVVMRGVEPDQAD